MKAGKTLKRAARLERHVPRRLRFEQLESRHMLSTWGWADAVAGAAAAPASDLAPATVMIRLQATDLCGQPIDRVALGDKFWLEIYAQDLRSVPKGVFAAYLDVNYDPALVSTGSGENAGLIFGTNYENGKSGEFLPGLIDEAGGFAGMQQTYDGEYLVFAVPMTATAVGVADFAGSPADPIAHDVLVYDSDSPVPWDEVRVLGAKLIVTGGAEADGAAGGRVSGEEGSQACGAAIVAGSGAELAASNPLMRPWEQSTKGPIYPVESYEPADPWKDDGAQPASTEPSRGGGWTDEWWLTPGPVDVIPLTFDWIEAFEVVDRWPALWVDSGLRIADSYEFDAAVQYDLSQPHFSYGLPVVTITLSEPFSGSLPDWSLALDHGSDLASPLPAGSSAVDVGARIAFATLEERSDDSRLAPASLQVPDATWTGGDDPWQPSDFPGWTVAARIESPTALAPRSLPVVPAQRPFDLETPWESLEDVLDQITADLALAGR